VVLATTKEDHVPIDEIIIRLFCMVEDTLGPVKGAKRSDAKLYLSEILTIGMLSALKGIKFRPFYRWLKENYREFFPNLPEQSRLHRLLRDNAVYTNRFLAEPSFFTIMDTYGIELLHPRREGRSEAQIGKKGKSNGRWIVGVKLAWLINNVGEVVGWEWDTANAADNVFRPLARRYDGETIALCDMGFRAAGEPPFNMKYCERGTWSERFGVETNLSWATELFHAKKLYHRVEQHLVARLGYMAALLNCLLRITEGKRSLLQFVL
jgi:hypothetical protein